MQDFEKQGVFYLGKILETGKKHGDPQLLLYDSKNLTTHAVCLGMTGSGKTGLGIVLLEEAALDGIPSIIIDPKGDLGNLLLTFPQLSPDEFLPWIDKAEAERRGISPEQYAADTAKTWADGLAKSGEGPERIQKLRNAVDMVIYTPASSAGAQISILSSFAAPSKELMMDPGAVRDRVLSITSSILGLLGINADPIKSREHILLSTIFSQAWSKGVNLDIATLIQQVQKPPFDKIGALDIDTFFPPKDRLALSISLNNLLASPGFQAWMEGEPLDIQKLLYSETGKPKLSILSIAHLSDAERMFFVTLLLNEFLSWMRRQPGTTNLRALLYMDEVFGFFPPVATPPSKLPMITLLKQARGFGVGIVLATQNPVDLDYKGLSNCGTWFIGKLQTERDKSRVLEGLRVASNGEIDAAGLDKLMSSIASRTFIMRSIYEKEPILFQTRWTMSYLRGPMTLTQIASLTKKSAYKPVTPNPEAVKATASNSKPAIAPGITEYFLNAAKSRRSLNYRPEVAGIAKLHFVDAKAKIDTWQDICILAEADDEGKTVLWEEGDNQPEAIRQFEKEPIAGSTFDDLPSGLMQEKNYSAFQKSLATALYQTQSLTIYHATELNQSSKDSESESEFRQRMALVLRDKREEMIKKLKAKYDDKIATLTDKVRRAEEKMTQRKQNVFLQWGEAILSFVATVLGAFTGRGVTKGTITSAGTSIRRAGRITTQSQSAASAEEDFKAYSEQLEDMKQERQREMDAISFADPNAIKVDSITIRPRKSDISVDKVALVWVLI